MNRYALVIGINDYEDRDNIQHLRFAVQDARRVDRFFHSCGFDVRTLTDSEATYDSIESRLYEIAERLCPGDVFLLYFSGHGCERGIGDDRKQYLLPRNARFWSLQHGGGAAISLRFIQDCTGKPGVGRAVILDCCRSQILTGGKGSEKSEVHYSSRDIKAATKSAPKDSPLAIVCSCHPDSEAYERSSLNGGIFTCAMLSVFEDYRKKGQPVGFFPELQRDIVERTKSILEEAGMPPQDAQAPWVIGSAEGVVLVPGREPLDKSDHSDSGRIQVLEKPKLKIETDPSSCSISIDGRQIGISPQSVGLKAGQYEIRAEKAGFEIWEQIVSFDGRGDATLGIKLTEIRGPQPGDTVENSIGMKLAWIPPGEFMMGSRDSPAEVAKKGDAKEDWYIDEHPQHAVRISQGFYICRTQVTRGQFGAFVSSSGYRTEAEKEGWAYAWKSDDWARVDGASWRNPGFSQQDNHPAVCVSWNDATEFCNWLSSKEQKDYRLPTEAEWEYACRAGSTTPFYTGETISTEQANYDGNYIYGKGCKGTYRKKTTSVASFDPNAFGLYDMHGNVWEWCQDWYDEDYYLNSPDVDPRGPATGKSRVLRGGSWCREPWNCRSANRNGGSPDFRLNNNGFRVVLLDFR